MAEILTNKEIINLGRIIVVFIGPEGSGKTTIAERLASECGKPYTTTGGILRELAANDSGPWGDECRTMFNDHRYLDGATLLKILAHRFSQPDCSEGLILDGGMRTVEETEDFPKMLFEAGLQLPLIVVHLRIPGWMSFERLRLRGRADDTPYGIEKRLAKYFFKLGERINFIEQQPGWQFIHVDGTGPVDEVYSRVKFHLRRTMGPSR